MTQNNKEKDKILQLKKDIVFQKLFGSEENKEITSYFLSLILERNITNINLDVNKELIGDSVHEKKGILDVRAKFNNGENVDIEIQLKKYRYMSKRVLTYWGQMYNQKLRIGELYHKLKPSTMVLITDYRLNETMGIEEYEYCY